LVHEGCRFVGIGQGDAVKLVTVCVYLAPCSGDDVRVGVLLDGRQVLVSVGKSLPCAVRFRREVVDPGQHDGLLGGHDDDRGVECGVRGVASGDHSVDVLIWRIGFDGLVVGVIGLHGPAPFDLGFGWFAPNGTIGSTTRLVGRR
jgi:hypothetical protein